MRKIKNLLIIVTFVLFMDYVNAFNYGDEVTYNNIKFNVLENNGNSVTMLKADPLTVSEVDYYGRGHINMYSRFKSASYTPGKTIEHLYEKKAFVSDEGYGSISYYSRKKCSNITKVYDGCISDYDKSDVKYVVDAWAKREIGEQYLVKDQSGYYARIFDIDEINKYYTFEQVMNPSYELVTEVSSDTPEWLYDHNLPDYSNSFWSKSPLDDGLYMHLSPLGKSAVYNHNIIRPVVTMEKSELERNNGVAKEYKIDDSNIEDLSNNKYKTGDIVNYKGTRFYVLNNNAEDNTRIGLLKAEPLTVDEVNRYGTEHINNQGDSRGIPNNINGYGGVAYYRSDTCYEDNDIGCKNAYEESDIKYIVDAWASSFIDVDSSNLKDLDLKIGLLTLSDLKDTLYYDGEISEGSTTSSPGTLKPKKANKIDLSYCWINMSYGDANSAVSADGTGEIKVSQVYLTNRFVCPVITLKKNPLPPIDEIDEPDEDIPENKNIIVDVPDTKLSKGIMIALSGFVIIGLSIVLNIINKRDKKGNRQ